METKIVTRVPLSNLTPEDFLPTPEEAKRAHELQQILIFCAERINDLFETAVRALREFADNPRLMRAAGWNSVEEMFMDPDVKGVMKVAVGSYEQQRRLLRIADIDRRLPSVGVLRVEHWTSITTTSRLPRLEKLVKQELPPDEMETRALNIIHGDLPEAEAKDEPTIEFDGRYITRNGVRVIRVTTADGILAARLVSLLVHLQIKWRLEGTDIAAYDKDGTRQMGGKLLVDDDEVLEWALRGLHARKALDK